MSTAITTKWSHLPNAVHIDRVIASVKSRPDQWGIAQNAVNDKDWNVAWDKATADITNWVDVWDTVWNFVRNTVARDALLCLIAYDDCAYMLDSEVGELKILAALGDHKAILLLPACVALNAIKNSD